MRSVVDRAPKRDVRSRGRGTLGLPWGANLQCDRVRRRGMGAGRGGPDGGWPGKRGRHREDDGCEKRAGVAAVVLAGVDRAGRPWDVAPSGMADRGLQAG